jgi:hypothetical protein
MDTNTNTNCLDGLNCVTNCVIRASYIGLVITTFPLFYCGLGGLVVIATPPIVLSYPIEYIVSGNIKYSLKQHKYCAKIIDNYLYFYFDSILGSPEMAHHWSNL